MVSLARQMMPLMAYLFAVVFAISLHEAAHGYVACFLGDSTAADEGRVSINPLRHVDLLAGVLLRCSCCS